MAVATVSTQHNGVKSGMASACLLPPSHFEYRNLDDWLRWKW